MTTIINWLKAWWKANVCDTFENVHPNYNPQCSACNKGGEACPTCPFVDKDYNPLAATDAEMKRAFKEALDEDYTPNINWSSGQDDVPPAPEGMRVYSKGKLSMAYINAKDEDIQAALDVVMQAISANSPEHHISVLKQVHAHLMRALL